MWSPGTSCTKLGNLYLLRSIMANDIEPLWGDSIANRQLRSLINL